jgi:putative ATP-dependent endonuclease of OLD family
MRISRVVIQNFRSFESLDVPLSSTTSCIIGENNTGKTNFLHAIRLCIDANLSSSYRSLIPSDIHSTVDISHPTQVLVGLEITDFAGKTNELALVGAWQSKPNLARLIYRYRPKLNVREDLESEEIKPGDLTHEDYHWEITAGGDPATDLADIEWDEDIGSSIRFGDLQSFLVVFLPALRDVESELRQFRNSPLAKLIEAMNISPDDKEELLQSLRDANEEISGTSTVAAISKAIDDSFKMVSGPAFSMDISVGLAEPSFQVIVRALRILLTNAAVDKFDPASNGLGLNNILYVSILIDYFGKRLAQKKSAGQIILFEEPEAHLHPQLQLTLFKALQDLPFQSILTTHSTHITAQAPLDSYVVLTQTGTPAISSSVPAEDADLDTEERLDLERYLDATKSSLLFARRVILVEGPAELFLVPALLKHVKNIDLQRLGISVIPIYGVHFGAYTKLFSEDSLPKKCAVIADGDLKASDADPSLEGEDDLPPPPDLKKLQNDFVHVFACNTTFERALVQLGTLDMFLAAAQDIEAPKLAKLLKQTIKEVAKDGLDDESRNKSLNTARDAVLTAAKRVGKARFAQIVARHVDKATTVPKYIAEAADWLIKS